jgi:hypothetical protein
MEAPTPWELTNRERHAIKGCLRAAVDGPFFPDWEFETIMSLSRDDVRKIALAWPHEPGASHNEFYSDEECQRIAANNAMNLVLGYPHGIEGWPFVALVGADPGEIEETLREWRGETNFDASPRGTFNRMM